MIFTIILKIRKIRTLGLWTVLPVSKFRWRWSGELRRSAGEAQEVGPSFPWEPEKIYVIRPN